MSPSFRGLALESSGPRLGVAVFDREGQVLAERSQYSEQTHARDLLAAVRETLAAAGVATRDLDVIAVDVGPGSFTALRVGLATARGLAHPWSIPVVGVTSFAALVDGLKAPKRLVVPLLIAGRSQLYGGFYRGDPRGDLSILRGPAAGTTETLLAAVDEALELCPRDTRPWFLGPGALRERTALEARHPGSIANGSEPPGAAGPDVAAVARLGARQIAQRPGSKAGPASGGPASGGPASGGPPARRGDDRLRPLYVRPPQAVERADPARPFWRELEVEPFVEQDLEEVLRIENAVFSDPWPRRFFVEEIALPQTLGRVVRHQGRVVGYLLAWMLEDEMHLGNIAVLPEYQRRGIGQFLLEWLVRRAEEARHQRVTLEVRASNFGAQELYRRYGFRAVALRRGYYHDTGEDALVMLRELA